MKKSVVFLTASVALTLLAFVLGRASAPHSASEIEAVYQYCRGASSDNVRAVASDDELARAVGALILLESGRNPDWVDTALLLAMKHDSGALTVPDSGELVLALAALRAREAKAHHAHRAGVFLGSIGLLHRGQRALVQQILLLCLNERASTEYLASALQTLARENGGYLDVSAAKSWVFDPERLENLAPERISEIRSVLLQIDAE